MSANTQKSISLPDEIWRIIDISIAEQNAQIPGTFTGRADYFEKVIKKIKPDLFRDPKEKIREEFDLIRKNIQDIQRETHNAPNLNAEEARKTIMVATKAVLIRLSDAETIIKTLKEY